MTQSIANPWELWVIDRTAESLQDSRRHFAQLGRPCPVQTFDRSQLTDAVSSIEKWPPGFTEGGRPWLVKLDMIGTDPVADGKSVIEWVRDRSPLTIRLLHSRSAKQRPRKLDELLRNRLVHRFIDKDRGADEVLNFTKEAFQRWNSPLARKVRQYIGAHDDPTGQFLENGEGGHLSLLDVYHEMIVNSPVGAEAWEAWRHVLDDASQPA